MRMRAKAVAIVVALISLLAAWAPAAAQTLEIIEFGTFKVRKSNCERDNLGILRCARLVQLDDQTTQVPAALDVEFGVRFRITGLPKGASVPVRRVWRFPEPGLQPPGKPRLNELERLDTVTAGEVTSATYGFDDEWELVTGDWVLEFWVGDKKLGEQRLTILRPTS